MTTAAGYRRSLPPISLIPAIHYTHTNLLRAKGACLGAKVAHWANMRTILICFLRFQDKNVREGLPAPPARAHRGPPAW